MVVLLLYLCVGKSCNTATKPWTQTSVQTNACSNPAPYVEPKIAFLKARQPSINAGMKEGSRGARSACPPSWLHLEGSMFNVSFSEQHTLRKESDAQRRNFERSFAGKCTTVLVQCSDLAQEFEM